MTEFGYALSSEEHAPLDLVKNARRAEDAGFTFAMISDHFHPWLDRQGHSPFVWSIIGGISQATQNLRLGTGVTCPILRIHPAIIAQAAATAAAMLPGRFMLGLGTGENLNEHILGDPWPHIDIRQEMLVEAVQVIRKLFEGKEVRHWGSYYTVEDARLYTLPKELPPILIAASGPESAAIAGEIGDGLISTSPKEEVTRSFKEAGGKGKPRYGQVTVCYAASETKARKTAVEWWATAAVPGNLAQELPSPREFEMLKPLLTEELVADSVVCGPDKRKHLDEIQKMVKAGYDHVYIHQVGPDQDSFFRFYQDEILLELAGAQVPAGGNSKKGR